MPNRQKTSLRHSIQSLRNRWGKLIDASNREVNLVLRMIEDDRKVSMETSWRDTSWQDAKDGHMRISKRMLKLAEKLARQHNEFVKDYNIWVMPSMKLSEI